MNKSAMALMGLCVAFSLAAHGEDQRPAQAQPAATSGTEVPQTPQPEGGPPPRPGLAAPSAAASGAAREGTPTVSPSASPQSGVSPLGAARAADCSPGKPAKKKGRDCDSEDDSATERAAKSPNASGDKR